MHISDLCLIDEISAVTTCNNWELLSICNVYCVNGVERRLLICKEMINILYINSNWTRYSRSLVRVRCWFCTSNKIYIFTFERLLQFIFDALDNWSIRNNCGLLDMWVKKLNIALILLYLWSLLFVNWKKEHYELYNFFNCRRVNHEINWNDNWLILRQNLTKIH